jgi:hypothetical protein
MSPILNLYCDESCHLANDHQPLMTLGVAWCPESKAREIAVRLREIKMEHGIPSDFDVKWTKVSPAKVRFYLDIIDYFFDDDDLHFRAWVADKQNLRHGDFNQTHDDWYYKMMFGLVEPLLAPRTAFRLYLDKKDTLGAKKVRRLHDVLCNNLYDFDRKIVERVQVVQSDHVEQLQLADLLLGAVGYANRGLVGSSAKLRLIQRICERSGYSLKKPTLLRESKFNIFIWKGRREA